MISFKNKFAVIVFAGCVLFSSFAAAQSLSDLQWDKFVGLTSGEDVQTHTDPFAGGVSSAEDLSIEELSLTGIVYGGAEDSYALISGYLVRVGDKIASYKVDAIEKDKVRLKRVDDVYVLVLGGGI